MLVRRATANSERVPCRRLHPTRIGTGSRSDEFVAAGARVQGVEEAPIAIYATPTSSHADAPRGMEFLYNLNPLNVATSRARCMSVLVSSPQLFEAECRTPRQIQHSRAFGHIITNSVSC